MFPHMLGLNVQNIVDYFMIANAQQLEEPSQKGSEELPENREKDVTEEVISKLYQFLIKHPGRHQYLDKINSLSGSLLTYNKCVSAFTLLNCSSLNIYVIGKEQKPLSNCWISVDASTMNLDVRHFNISECAFEAMQQYANELRKRDQGILSEKPSSQLTSDLHSYGSENISSKNSKIHKEDQSENSILIEVDLSDQQNGSEEETDSQDVCYCCGCTIQ